MRKESHFLFYYVPFVLIEKIENLFIFLKMSKNGNDKTQPKPKLLIIIIIVGGFLI